MTWNFIQSLRTGSWWDQEDRIKGGGIRELSESLKNLGKETRGDTKGATQWEASGVRKLSRAWDQEWNPRSLATPKKAVCAEVWGYREQFTGCRLWLPVSILSLQDTYRWFQAHLGSLEATQLTSQSLGLLHLTRPLSWLSIHSLWECQGNEIFQIYNLSPHNPLEWPRLPPSFLSGYTVHSWVCHSPSTLTHKHNKVSSTQLSHPWALALHLPNSLFSTQLWGLFIAACILVHRSEQPNTIMNLLMIPISSSSFALISNGSIHLSLCSSLPVH